MITVSEAIELLQKCNPKAIIRIAIPGNDYSENVTFVEQCDEKEVHFCNTKPEERPTFEDYLNDNRDYWIEVISETDNFAKININPGEKLGSNILEDTTLDTESLYSYHKRSNMNKEDRPT